MTRAERRVLAALADGEWHDETEVRSTRALLERLWLSGTIQGAMHGVGAYPEHRLWRLGRDPSFPPRTTAGQFRPLTEEERRLRDQAEWWRAIRKNQPTTDPPPDGEAPDRQAPEAADSRAGATRDPPANAG